MRWISFSIRFIFFCHILGKPRVSPDFYVKNTVYTALNLTATFEFKAIARPMPEFHWFKLSGSFWIILKTSYKYNIHTSGCYTNFSVISITEDDYGHYMLKIQNNVGSLEQLYSLKADGKYQNIIP